MMKVVSLLVSAAGSVGGIAIAGQRFFFFFFLETRDNDEMTLRGRSRTLIWE